MALTTQIHHFSRFPSSPLSFPHSPHHSEIPNVLSVSKLLVLVGGRDIGAMRKARGHIEPWRTGGGGGPSGHEQESVIPQIRLQISRFLRLRYSRFLTPTDSPIPDVSAFSKRLVLDDEWGIGGECHRAQWTTAELGGTPRNHGEWEDRQNGPPRKLAAPHCTSRNARRRGIPHGTRLCLRVF